jgi:hypothetical protein
MKLHETSAMRTRSPPVAAILVALAFQTPALANDQPASPSPLPDYMRYAEDARSARLEIAIRSFKLPSGQQVDLIGVVHIADDAYFQLLNQRFDAYDSVLFELVGDPQRLTETPPQVLKQQAEREYTGALSTLQQTAGRYLNLTFQLGAIDYTRKNMVHADTSAAEFAQMQRERGENLLTLFLRAMNAQFSSGPHNAAMYEFNTFALIRMLLSPDSATEFKKALARVFDQAESMTAIMEGAGGSVVLTGRNDVAVAKLREVLANRKQRRVAVFYGSGHMPGIEAILIGKLDAKVTGEEWLAAWTMPKAAKQGR